MYLTNNAVLSLSSQTEYFSLDTQLEAYDPFEKKFEFAVGTTN
jgi:hypothetical protein